MDYEKKYKEIFEAVRHLAEANPSDEGIQSWINDNFPELKESESIRMINFISNELACIRATDEKGTVRYNELTDAIAWLEKQGEKEEPQVYEIENGEVITYSESEGYKVVEPKFKVGDWVIDKIVGGVWHIDSIDNKNYQVSNGDKHCYFPIEKQDKMHRWTIQDAKVGDVLAASDGSIFLFAGVVNRACKYYAVLTTENYVKINKDANGGWETSITVFYPATKEECDLLFQKMKEAGYEWNAEKKELKKIVAPIFHIGDRVRYKGHSCDGVITEITNTDYICGDAKLPILTQNKLELVEQKSAWSKEDEWKFTDILALLRGGENFHYNTPDLFEWLKSLKDRVQPKVEWSEEDSMHLTNAILAAEKEWGSESCTSKWLKSLRPQKQWKPTEEQINALEWQVNHTSDGLWQHKATKELLEQLKQL